MTEFVKNMAENLGGSGVFKNLSATEVWTEHQKSLPEPVRDIIEDHLERLDD